ncbi:MAG: hypothetical protein ABJC12_05320 [Saprospiraceae bacterium]
MGPPRENPYTVENFTAAYNELYNPDITSLPVTNFYIKFTPNTHEQLELLSNSELNIVEFPLDREVTHLGDFYIEHGTPRDQIVPMYAVVTPGQVLPQVPYTNLANLYLGSSDEALVRQALRRKGYNPDDIGYVIEPNVDGGGGGGGGGGGEFTTNSCGCQVYSDSRKPGGCIKVKDVQKNTFQGVRQVRIVIKDSFFDFHTAYTDDAGCFKVNSRFFGNAFMWVHFNSDSGLKIRGVKTGWASIVQWIFPVKHHLGTIRGPYYNDIQVKYDSWSDEGSDAHVYWGAATVGNAVHEFHDFAVSDNINPSPSHLDIFVGKHLRYGYTLMTGQYEIAAAIGLGISGALFWTGPFGQIAANIATASILLYLPDVFVGINYHNSDELKELTYHEIAHSSHYVNVNIGYWDALVWAEIVAGGHGSSSSPNAGLISLVESWAEFVGETYAHRTYLNLNTSQFGSWLIQLERTRNESIHHIPIGFYNDLVDNSPDTGLFVCDQDFLNCGSIDDQASGFSISQMYNLLTFNTSSPQEFKDKLIDGVQQSIKIQVNNLFNDY